MKTVMRAASLACLLLALTAAAGVRAQEADLDELLRRLPAECVVVVGTTDARASLAALRPWVDALLPGPEGEAGAQFGAARWLDDLAPVFSGPLVAGVTPEGTWRLVACTERTQGEALAILRKFPLAAAEAEGHITIGPSSDPFLLAVREGVLVGASSNETLEALARSSVPVGGAVLDHPEVPRLLGAPAVADAAVFLLTLREPLTKTEMGPMTYHYGALLGYLPLAVGQTLFTNAAAVLCLEFSVDRIRLTGTVLVEGAQQQGAQAPALQLPELANWPVQLRATGLDFASIIDHIERTMKAFDPDVAAEFREELAELNRDLGYDFQRDLLANLGSAWTVGILPPENDGAADWVFACGLHERDKFIRCVQGLARLSQEPWQETESIQGARCFSTRAFTVPLEIAVAEDGFLMGSSPRAVRTMLERGTPAGTAAGPLDADAMWEVRAVAHWTRIAELLPDDEEHAALRNWMSKLPTGARATLHLRRLREAVRLELAFEGAGPEDLRAASKPAVHDARRKAHKQTCMKNMRSMALAITMCTMDHDEEYPASLADVFPYMPVKELFVCPADEDPVTIGEDLRCSYLYLKLLAMPRDPGRVLIARERRGNHEGGVNALFGDFHVEWVAEAELPGLLEESLRLLKEKDWDKYTPEQQQAIEAFYTIKARD